jgi:hypothetical protein
MNSDNASASYGSILRLSNALSLRRKCLGYRGCYTEIQIPRRTTADIYGSLITGRTVGIGRWKIKSTSSGWCVNRIGTAWTSNSPRSLYGRGDNQIEVEFPSWLQELLLLTYFDKVSFKFECRSDFEKELDKISALLREELSG